MSPTSTSLSFFQVGQAQKSILRQVIAALGHHHFPVREITAPIFREMSVTGLTSQKL